MIFPKIRFKDIQMSDVCETYIRISKELSTDTVFRMVDDLALFGSLYGYDDGVWTFLDMPPGNLSLALSQIKYEFPNDDLREMVTGFEFFDSETEDYYAFGCFVDEAYLDHSKSNPHDDKVYTYRVYEITMEDSE